MADREPTDNPHASAAAPPEFRPPERDESLTPLLRRLLDGDTLDAGETTTAFEIIMSGRAHDGEIGALLALLATRVPTPAEILGAARVMRAHVERVESSCDADALVDTAGTGGAPKTFNVSTAAAIVAAAAGTAVAKHGNRSRTRRGSAEVLRQLGVDVDADRAAQARCLEQARICFCFAIHHHPAARHVMPVRLALGFPTIFNLLGPLTNPAGARRQVMGVYDPAFLHPIAEALRELGATRAMVLHADDGLDEISLGAPTRVVTVRDGRVAEERIAPEDVGLARADRAAVTARDVDHAAAMVRDVIDGREAGPPRDMTLLNAAAALVVAEVAESWSDGVARARAAIDDGAARRTLDALIECSRS